MQRLLLISNSTNSGEAYLSYPQNEIKTFLRDISEVVFIPYAGVTFSFDEYESKVQESLSNIGITIRSIHHSANPIETISNAEAIMVGGGNTFQLVALLHQLELMDAIKTQINKGVPYIGWSAGSNIACPTMKTTNDMPIVQPASFNTLNLVPFQINPHYLDANPEGHGGETREQRITEFLELNRDIQVVGLREGTMLKIEDNNIQLIGSVSCRIFKYNEIPKELTTSNNLNFLLRQ